MVIDWFWPLFLVGFGVVWILVVILVAWTCERWDNHDDPQGPNPWP